MCHTIEFDIQWECQHLVVFKGNIFYELDFVTINIAKTYSKKESKAEAEADD